MEPVWTHQEQKFRKRFISSGQTQREYYTYWYNKKSPHTKYDIEEFTYDWKGLGKMIGMAYEQTLEEYQRILFTKM